MYSKKIFLFSFDLINTVGYLAASTITFARRRYIDEATTYCEFCHRIGDAYEGLNANHATEASFNACTRCVDEIRMVVNHIGPLGSR
jgi:hypothetical protein